MRSLRAPVHLAALLALGLAAPARAGAQELSAVTDAQVSEREAARLLRQARAEQARFERVRRNNVPLMWGGGGGECDERIGRFCLTHSDASPTDTATVPEPAEIGEARDRLIAALDAAAGALPGDPWVVGQRVRYLVEGERLDEALAAARACRAEAWWCTALEGFALHSAGEAERAHAAFDRLLAELPEREHREWTDLSLILDGCTQGEYSRLDAAERDRFEHRFWHLADPFQSRPGNELRSEHLSRNVWDRLQDRARSTEGISWGSDLREILIRYGWPRSWKRVRERPGMPLGGPPSMVSHYAGTDRELVPPCEVFRADGGIARGSWDEDPRRPRTGYAFPMPDSAVEWVHPIDHQVAAFRRADSALLVAAYEIPVDSVPAGAWFETALALLPAAGEQPRVTAFPRQGLHDVVATPAPAGPMLLSLEAFSTAARRAGRVRFGLEVPPPIPGLLAVSDLLLLRTADALPDSLPAALPLARHSTRLRPGERFGVYWEVYGLEGEQSEQLSMSLRLVESDAGWLRRLGRRIGLVDRVPPVRVRWQEGAPDAGTLARSLALAIPEELDPGRYALELSVSLPGRETLTVARVVEVER